MIHFLTGRVAHVTNKKRKKGGGREKEGKIESKIKTGSEDKENCLSFLMSLEKKITTQLLSFKKVSCIFFFLLGRGKILFYVPREKGWSLLKQMVQEDCVSWCIRTPLSHPAKFRGGSKKKKKKFPNCMLYLLLDELSSFGVI